LTPSRVGPRAAASSWPRTPRAKATARARSTAATAAPSSSPCPNPPTLRSTWSRRLARTPSPPATRRAGPGPRWADRDPRANGHVGPGLVRERASSTSRKRPVLRHDLIGAQPFAKLGVAGHAADLHLMELLKDPVQVAGLGGGVQPYRGFVDRYVRCVEGGRLLAERGPDTLQFLLRDVRVRGDGRRVLLHVRVLLDPQRVDETRHVGPELLHDGAQRQRLARDPLAVVRVPVPVARLLVARLLVMRFFVARRLGLAGGEEHR